MHVELQDPSDRQTLERLAAAERHALQRDRYRAVLLALEDAPEELEGDEIAERLGRSPRFVDQWLARYRGGGVGNLRARKQPGRRPKLGAEQAARLKARLEARLEAGPTEADGGVCAFRGRDVCGIVEREFGVVHTVGGIYDVLERLGFSCLMPRPRHRKNDPEAMRQFAEERAPLLSAT